MYTTRFADKTDEIKIFNLYKQVAKNFDGIAREEDEITHEYITNNLQKSLTTGVCLLIDNPDNKEEILAEIHCYKLEPRVFNHLLSNLTIVVNQNFHNQGLGKLLFTTLLKHIEKSRSDILRVELIARESNEKAIGLYKNLGFAIEGRFVKRIDNKTKQFEADIPMVWFNGNHKKC